MDVEKIRNWALGLSHVEEGFPFGESTLVFKVNGKIFLLLSLDETPATFNVKCNPEKAISLREEYPQEILPGYHMNKKHWNTIILNRHLPSSLLEEMILDSYQLVCKAVPKK